MELSRSNFKNFLHFLVFQETETPKKIPYISGNENPKKASYISRNGTFQCAPKIYLIFSQKKAFHIFWETKIPKKFVIFQETELSYISGNRTFLHFGKGNFLIFQEVTFRAQIV